ncbi:MAG: hypothetical protein LBD12_00670, partial [Clostridiales Family XIII bacterium]|nr:hypothetical protein [Clostridiales Family XIII bacterium]
EPWRIFSRNPNEPPHYIDAGAEVANSMVSEGCHIYGKVEHSILSSGVTVEKGAVVRDSIIMAETRIGAGSHVNMSILDEHVTVGSRAVIGEEAKNPDKGKIAVVGSGAVVRAGARVEAGKQVEEGAVVRKAPVRKAPALKVPAPKASAPKTPAPTASDKKRKEVRS